MSKPFNKEVIETLLSKLSEKRGIFCSEADFQLELAYYIREYLSSGEDGYHDDEFKILPEYYYKIEEDDPIYIDILVIINEKWYPIELKYKTRGNSNSKVELNYSENGCNFILKNHSAYNDNCCKYLYDIRRIEKIRANLYFENFGGGYAIMLSNDLRYWKGPVHESCHDDFLLKDDTDIKVKKEFILDGAIKECFDSDYHIKWKNYGKALHEGKFTNCRVRDVKLLSQFKYVICEIEPKKK